MISYVALGFFSIATATGLFIALKHLSYKPVSRTSGFTHGTLGWIGFALILTEGIINGFSKQLVLFAALFSVVAFLGAYMFSLRLQDRDIPLPVVLLHGTLAIAAIFILVILMFPSLWY
jgi:hypothetical protein